MTTYTFPTLNGRQPNTMAWQLIANTAVFRSPFTGAIQTAGRGGEYWTATLGYSNLTAAEASELTAFLTRLNGQEHRFLVTNYSSVPRGTLDGSPVVSGAGQSGNTLNIAGAGASVVGWIQAGDFFEVNGELKQCVADADSDGAGAVTVEFVPRLRVSPPDGDPIIVTNPSGTFLLSDDAVTWAVQPGTFTALAIDCIEDVLA